MTGYPLLVAVRLLPGVVGETKRVCHIAAVPQQVPEADSLTTYCGIRIWRDQAEILSVPRGMPCEVCLARVRRAVHTGHKTGNDVLDGGNTAPELCPSTGLQRNGRQGMQCEKKVVTMTAEPAIQDRATADRWVPVRAGAAGARPTASRRRGYTKSGVTTVRCAVLPPSRPGADRTAGLARVGGVGM